MTSFFKEETVTSEPLEPFRSERMRYYDLPGQLLGSAWGQWGRGRVPCQHKGNVRKLCWAAASHGCLHLWFRLVPESPRTHPFVISRGKESDYLSPRLGRLTPQNPSINRAGLLHQTAKPSSSLTYSISARLKRKHEESCRQPSGSA